MDFRFLFLIFLTLFFSCNNEKNKVITKTEKKSQSVDFQPLSIEPISEKAQPFLKQWPPFGQLVQLVTTISPAKIKNTESLMALQTDSVLVYKRFSAKNQKITLKNMNVNQDWRTIQGVKDTIFKLEKTTDDEEGFIGWNDFLVKGVPYTFSIFAKNVNYNIISLEFSNEKEIFNETFALDSIKNDNSSIKKKINLADNWKELRCQFTPQKDATYSIKMRLDNEAKNGNHIIFYRPTLQILTKDLSKIEKFSDKIIQEQNDIKTSYYTIFFWLKQLEDELKQLWLHDDFPEKINIPSVKARFRLFETNIKLLADNIKNNPDFSEEEVKKAITEIGSNFNAIILRINATYNSDLDEKMKNIQPSYDTIP